MSDMHDMEQRNRDHISKQEFMDTMINYLWNTPFDAERFALIVQEYVEDEEINVYLETIVHDYDQWDEVDEVQARWVIYDKVNLLFPNIFADYYNEDYLTELINHSEEDISVQSNLADILHTPVRETQSQLYIQKIQQSFQEYPSSDARRSMIAGAKKILIEELIGNRLDIWEDEYTSV